MDYEDNHHTRTQSPRLSADPLQLSVDAGSDLETKKSSVPSARLSCLGIMREYTEQQQQPDIVLGSNACV